MIMLSLETIMFVKDLKLMYEIIFIGFFSKLKQVIII